MRGLVAIALLCISQAAVANLYYDAARKYGVDPILVQAIAKVESRGIPWAMNIDGESFWFSSKQDLLNYYRYVRSRPIMLRTWRDGSYRYAWFARVEDAEGLYVLERRRDIVFRVTADNRRAVVRRVDPENVDLGVMEVNWRIHARTAGVSFEALLEPAINIDYAVRYLSRLIQQYGLWEGVARYHCGACGHPARRRRYQGLVYTAYQQIHAATAARNRTLLTKNDTQDGLSGPAR